MKVRKPKIMMNDRELQEFITKETQKEFDRLSDKAYYDAFLAAMAVVMVILNREFGFGKKRLEKFKDDVEGEFMAMIEGVLGQKYETNDCVKIIKEKFGIDLQKSIYDEYYENVRK